MRFIKALGPEATPEDWVLWGILWGCAGLLAGGFAVLVGVTL